MERTKRKGQPNETANSRGQYPYIVELAYQTKPGLELRLEKKLSNSVLFLDK